ncbi:hypothetical protein A8990_106135 [Paenibacillus taihuensis]|uniref:YCII-related domain-containing protein n=1 Tax=Paenibacillus taihuensis TaxID=1156355 RepID=A0A3D9SBH5_9BACL|nr:hypothetical protein [Paenibacillus taihuensis]REE90630.1 hypothetical protein A8990_106135 [Paenibacillus taihuensis]
MAGRTSPLDETTFGIVIFKATGEREARQFMQQDPAVAEGVMKAELFLSAWLYPRCSYSYYD